MVDDLRAPLVGWFRANARDLPWRHDPTPYRVWVSEIMLQQTRVETVVGYYDRFLRRFPTLESLAHARLEDVLAAWSGLGYYRRARLLHAGARAVVDDHGGELPRAEADIRRIPGIGPYTAGAILSIAFGERAPILDGNGKRILSRLFAVEGDVSKAPAARRLWDLARALVRDGSPSEVNQAQMELGALVCTPTSPSCADCPVSFACAAHRAGTVSRYPRLPTRRAPVDVECVVALVTSGDRVLLRRRVSGELHEGLWDLPGGFTGDAGDVGTDASRARELVPLSLRFGPRVGEIRHMVTHRRVRLLVHAVSLREPVVWQTLVSSGGATLAWFEREAALALALPAPTRRVLTELWSREPSRRPARPARPPRPPRATAA